MENLFFDKKDLKKCGSNVIIGKTVRIRYPHLVEIGDNVIIDDFTYISTSLKIHSYVHISSGCKLIGGPDSYVEMQNFSTLSPNVVLSAGSDDYLSGIATPLVDKKYKANSEIGNIILKEHTIVGSNSTVLPNVTFNTGSTVGANSLIKEDLEEWTLNVGIPSRKIKNRNKAEVIKAEKDFFKEESSKNEKILKNGKNSKIILATQGSQGILTLRELFNLGYKKENIEIYVCESKFNSPLIEFLKYLDKEYFEINDAKSFDKIADKDNKQNILLSVSWKYLISKKVLKSFNNRAINFHPGLLPEYKGCFSSSWSLINNEKHVGFTYHFMNEDFDSGNIIYKSSIRIEKEDDAFSLNYKIFQQGIPKLGNVLNQIESSGTKQKSKGKYYPNKLPHNGELQLEWDKDFANRFIRAINFPPYPPAYLSVDEKIVSINDIKDFMRYKK
tara:strand:+ start:9235 stop:10566 length:1332 start_codon:yes stop_codon:yes gene_type:complete